MNLRETTLQPIHSNFSSKKKVHNLSSQECYKFMVVYLSITQEILKSKKTKPTKQTTPNKQPKTPTMPPQFISALKVSGEVLIEGN